MSNYTIQTGFWINHSAASPALGATITVPIRWGNYLIAALSSLIAWAGARAWSILYFWLHQRLAAAPQYQRDLLHQQLQIHFRAGGSPWDGLADGLDLHRAWRRRGQRRIARRTLSLVFGAMLFFAVFAAAGIFVAEVASQSYQDVLVLAVPNDCGDLVIGSSPGRLNDYYDASARFQSESAAWARNYARDAYASTGLSSNVRFGAFPYPRLPTEGHEVDCPFNDGNTTCLGVNATKGGNAWRMDTTLDSHTHLGINAPPQDRVRFSKQVTCAVVDPIALTTKTYTRVDRDATDGSQSNKTYIGVLQEYGQDLGSDSNLLFEFPVGLTKERIGYYIQRAVFLMGLHDPEKDLTAPPFRRYDADVTLSAILQSRMFYYTPVDDPLFLAHQAGTGEEFATSTNVTVYYPSNTFGLMSCTEQLQLCKSDDPKSCTSWNGTMGFRDQLGENRIGLNSAQHATAYLLWNAWTASGASIGNFAARGNAGLTVAETRGVRAGYSIGPKQWQAEVDLWFASGVAALQAGVLSWTTKPWVRGRQDEWSVVRDYAPGLVNMTALDATYKTKGLTEAKERLCTSQLIRSTAAMQNFSVLALVLVLVVCVAIIVTASVLPACVGCVRERKKRREGRLSSAAEAGALARLADGKYSLLAMALANAGVGDWERSGIDGVPVTKKGSGQVEVCNPLKPEGNGIVLYPCAECGACGIRKSDAVKDGEEPAQSEASTSGFTLSVSEAVVDEAVGADKVRLGDDTADGRIESGNFRNEEGHPTIEKVSRSETDATLVIAEKRT